MYAYQSLQDYLFLMLYGGVTMLAFAAGLYLWLRRSNTIVPGVTPPRALRQWTALFFITAALSHVWWFVLGVYWLTDDRLVRNITAVTLDYITLVPLVMGMLLHMLQDRRRRLWPWVLVQVPVVAIAAIGIIKHDEFYGLGMTHYWQMVVTIIFLIYYIHALVQYGRWLHDNYADLEHKEVWQSLLFVVFIFIVYEVYSTNPGVMAKEYLAQFNTVIIVGFLLWRVESLQTLEVKETDKPMNEPEDSLVVLPSNIGAMLQEFCETPKLYLLHDLTLAQLSEAVGTNRTYLSTYFSQQGISYNTYINRLRIAHFERLYRDSLTAQQFVTAQQLAHECGFKSYSTFSVAFKQFKGQTVTAWMSSQISDSQNLQ